MSAGSGRGKRGESRQKPADNASAPNRAALWAGAASGMLSLVYEIAWTRVLTLILGSTVYAFTAMLATFLAGLAVGAFHVEGRGGGAVASR